MEWVVGLVIFLGALVAIGLLQGQRNRRTATDIEKRIRHLDDFEPADVYVSTSNLAGVAIDLGRRELLLADEDALRRFTVSSIISCEILEDDIQLAYANRGSQLAGIAVGGILLGGVGAVIGGLSGSKRRLGRARSTPALQRSAHRPTRHPQTRQPAPEIPAGAWRPVRRSNGLRKDGLDTIPANPPTCYSSPVEDSAAGKGSSSSNIERCRFGKCSKSSRSSS